MTWNDLAVQSITDKSSFGHDYLPAYQALLEGHDVRSVCELGVYYGASLRLWSRIWPDAHILGVDCDPAGRRAASEHITVVAPADVTWGLLAQELAVVYGPFDLIVDDGSHHVTEVQAAFDVWSPHLREGGLYVIEDLHATTDPPFDGPGHVEWVRSFAAAHGARLIPSGEKPESLDPCLIVVEAAS